MNTTAIAEYRQWLVENIHTIVNDEDIPDDFASTIHDLTDYQLLRSGIRKECRPKLRELGLLGDAWLACQNQPINRDTRRANATNLKVIETGGHDYHWPDITA